MSPIPNKQLIELQNDVRRLQEKSVEFMNKISPIRGKLTHRKQLYFQFVITSDYYLRSILELSLSNMPYTANSLLRSLWENSLNFDYVSIDRSNLSAMQFRLTKYLGIYGQLGKVDEWASFRQNNPSADTWKKNLNEQKLKDARDNIEIMLRKEIRRLGPKGKDYTFFDTHKWPSPKLRARSVDIREKTRNIHYTNSVEWDYLVVYWLLSEQVHLGPQALDEISKSYLSPDQGLLDLENYRMLSVSFSLHSLVLKKMCLHFRIPIKEEANSWRQIRTRHNKAYVVLENDRKVK